ncbi:predicted protein [Histoplasma capsulatum var. duboisii H88]|uniref:Predicted protein n=1 Tax=Ajellomyces capsulatus (strain H88) TaxID=544711 RepID=F0US67_AJEC8|nr:predicted protein [Histoplasma capsulatum var. duboisii H88]
MAGRKGGWRYKPGTSCGNIGRGASVAASGGRANRGPRKRGVFWRAASGMRVLQRYCARGSAKFLVLLIACIIGNREKLLNEDIFKVQVRNPSQQGKSESEPEEISWNQQPGPKMPQTAHTGSNFGRSHSQTQIPQEQFINIIGWALEDMAHGYKSIQRQDLVGGWRLATGAVHRDERQKEFSHIARHAPELPDCQRLEEDAWMSDWLIPRRLFLACGLDQR